MLRLTLIIGDEDASFAKEVSSYLRENYAKIFRIFTFTDAENMIHFLDKERELPQLLICSEYLYRQLNRVHAFRERAHLKDISVLITGSELARTGTESNGHLYKYKPANLLFQEIRDFIGMNMGLFLPQLLKAPHSIRNTRMYSFYAPQGGSGNTSICLGSALLKAKEGHSVLYLNFEEIPSTLLHFKENSEPDSAVSKQDFSSWHQNILMSESKKKLFDTLGKSEQGEHSADAILRSAIRYDEFLRISYLFPNNIYILQEVKQEEFVRFIDGLYRLGAFEYIFVDLPRQIKFNMLSFLAYSDTIFLVQRNCIWSREKVERFEREIGLIEERECVKIGDKIISIINMTADTDGAPESIFKNKRTNALREQGANYMFKDSMKLPYVKNLWHLEGERFILNLDTTFGAKLEGILALVEQKSDSRLN